MTSCNSGSNDEIDQQADESIVEAKEQTEYDNLTTYLDSYLYVNDMPTSINVNDMPDTSEGDFIGILKLYSIENYIPNTNISSVKLYVIQENNILWQSEETTEIFENTSENYLGITFRNGPSNLRYKTVDIVLEFTFENEKIQIMQKTLYIDSVV